MCQIINFKNSFQIFAFILLFSNGTKVAAQDFFLNYEIGYNMHFMKPEGANFVVNRYNETRNFLDNEMDEFNNLDGFTMGIGMGLNRFGYFEVGFNGRGKTRFARGNVSGQNFQRDLRVRNNGVYFGAGYPIGEGSLRIIPGIRADLSFLKVHTKIGNPDAIDDIEWDEIYDGTIIHGVFVCKFMIGAIAIEPYYTLELFPDTIEYGFEYVNEAINPNTYQNDPNYIPFDGGGFGIRFVFNTGFLEF